MEGGYDAYHVAGRRLLVHTARVQFYLRRERFATNLLHSGYDSAVTNQSESRVLAIHTTRRSMSSISHHTLKPQDKHDLSVI